VLFRENYVPKSTSSDEVAILCPQALGGGWPQPYDAAETLSTNQLHQPMSARTPYATYVIMIASRGFWFIVGRIIVALLGADDGKNALETVDW